MPTGFASVLDRVGGARQAAIIAVGVLVTALVLGVSRWATAPEMVPVVADVPVEAVGTMTDRLAEAGIPFELGGGGATVRVAAADLARARVALAREPLPGAGRPGLELFDQPTWGMTDFTQRVNYRRALEGELERTIGKMRDVERAEVHLALEDDAVFKRDERPSKASVTLTMKGGGTPPDETVRGIASLVAGSVGGLEPGHVTIVDERGRALTMDGDGSVTGLTSRQLAVQREVEQHLERKALTLLSSLVGGGNARVQVAAAINFDKVERTTQAVDPDRQALATEQRAEVTPSAPQQGAGYSTVATSYENTRSVETFTGAIGNLQKLTVAVLVADRLVPAADTATAAAPTFVARDSAELARIETLVRNALGVDSARGDVVSVVSAPFDLPAVATRDTLPTPTLAARLASNPKPIVAIAALVVVLVVALLALRALRPAPAPQAAVPLPAAQAAAALPAGTPAAGALPAGAVPTGTAVAPATPAPDARAPIVLPPAATRPELEQAIATVEQRPDAAVRVVRNWIRS
jgi:flagellar M-ring protein FliF